MIISVKSNYETEVQHKSISFEKKSYASVLHLRPIVLEHWVLVAYAYNSSYRLGRQRSGGSWLQANPRQLDPISKTLNTKQVLAEWLKL
jgi:hypothetical protein